MMTNSVYSCEALTALPIHASAVQAKEGALLFLGPSETGKSTIRSMLEAHLPAPVSYTHLTLPTN